MGVPRITDDERRARIGTRHLLSPTAGLADVVDIADALIGLHSSDPATVYLSAMARMTDPSIDAVHTALHDDTELLRHHAMRRTLWVFGRHTARVAHAAATRRIVGPERRKLVKLLEERAGLPDGEAWLDGASDEVMAELETRDTTTTRAIGDALPDLKIPIEMAPGKAYNATQSALSRVLLQLGFEGRIGRAEPAGGSWINSQYAWAPITRWLAEGIDGIAIDAAETELAQRWLRTFGPAPASDLQWWAGWPVGVTAMAIERTGAVEVDLHGGTGWILPDDLDTTDDPESWVALLPALDPTTMGWKSRDWYLDPAHVALLFDRNGNAGPTVWVDGRIVGGWIQRPDGTVAIEVLGAVDREQRSAIGAAAHRVEARLGDSRVKVRFPAPLQKQLLG